MPKLTKTVKASYLAGELSPSYVADVESADYQQGMSKLENFMVDVTDGIKNCPGLQFTDYAYTPTEQSRIIPFEFNEEQAYMIELCDVGMRVIKDGALVLRSIRNATYKWTASGSGTDEYYLELFAGGDPGLLEPKQAFEDGVNMLVSNPGFLVASGFGFGDNDTLGYNTVYARLTDGTDPDGKAADFVEIPFLITSPYPIADVGELDHTQSADTLFLFHGDYRRRKVTRTADNAWTITEVPATDGPYQVPGADDRDTRIKAVYVSTNLWDLTASTAIFGDVAVGDCIRLGFPIPGVADAIHWVWFVVTDDTSSLLIRAAYQGEFIAGDKALTYEQVVDDSFKDGVQSWEDHSDTNSTLGFDFANQAAVLTDGATGSAKMQQAVLTFAQVKHILTLQLHSNTRTLVDIVDAAYKWTASGSGTGEYYLEASGSGDPGVPTPVAVLENSADMTIVVAGAGSLAAGEWTWDNNDGLGWGNAIYIRLSDDADPDSKAQGYVQYTLSDPQVALSIGTTSLGSEIYGPVAYTTASVPQFVLFTPTASTIYVSLSTNGSTDADVVKIARVSIKSIEAVAGEVSYHTTKDWRLGAFNATHGYPKHGIISNQRMILANIKTKPQNIYASELANFEGFGESNPSRSTDGFSFFPATNEINGIRWIIDKGGLKAGTADAVWRIFAPSGGVIAPLDVAVDVDEIEGSLPLKPIVAHNAIIMTPRGSSPVLEMVSSLEAQGFATKDLGSRAGHLFENRRIVRWAFAKDPDSVIWCVLDDGSLVGLTYHRRLDVWGWFTRTCPLGEGYVDVAVVPNSSDDNTDDVYFVVNRGGFETGPSLFPDNFFIERLNRRITPQTAAYGLSASGTAYDYKILDSAVTLDDPKDIGSATQADPVVIGSTAHGFSNGDLIRIQNVKGMTELNNNVYKVASAAANTYELTDEDDVDIDSTGFGQYNTGGEAREMVLTLTGLGHLNGQTITAIADGAAREGLLVSAGSTTLPQKASFAHAGIPYTSTAEGMDIEINAFTQGGKKQFSAVDLYFVDSRECKVYASTDATKTQPVEFENESTGEQPPSLFTGVKKVDIKSDSVFQVRLGIIQDKPYPVHIRRAIIHADFER